MFFLTNGIFTSIIYSETELILNSFGLKQYLIVKKLVYKKVEILKSEGFNYHEIKSRF